jgi:trehalose 6-phosphate phosphatase
MTHVLARAGRAALERIARRGALLVFDFDGTLAPIVAQPAAARMREATRRLLRALARRHPCAVVSGRALGDLRRRVEGVPLAGLVGNHGAEPAPTRRGAPAMRGGERAPGAAAAARRTVRRWSRDLAARLDGLPGVALEDKGLTLTVHFRLAPDPRAAARAVRASLDALDGARLVPGKFGINVFPPGAPHKGTAVLGLRRRLGLHAALYVGDDRTDEDAFAAGSARELVAVRVGRGRRSRARFYLRDQREIDALLAILLSLPAPPRVPGARRPGRAVTGRGASTRG